jgi:hypothetical protein
MSKNSVSGFLLEKIPEAKDGKQKVTYVFCYTVFSIHVLKPEKSISQWKGRSIAWSKRLNFFCKMMSKNSVTGFLLEKIPEAKDGKQKVTCSGIQFSRSTF